MPHAEKLGIPGILEQLAQPFIRWLCRYACHEPKMRQQGVPRIALGQDQSGILVSGQRLVQNSTHGAVISSPSRAFATARHAENYTRQLEMHKLCR